MTWPSDSEHNTLVASVVTTVTLDQDYERVTLVHHGNAPEAVYFTVDGADPAVAGPGVDALLSGDRTQVVAPGGSGGTVVKLISAGTPTVTVSAGGR